MIQEDLNLPIALKNEYIQSYVKEAYKFYESNEVKREYTFYAIDIIIRYLIKLGSSWPRERNVLYIAALYIADRHPFSHPNPTSRFDFAKRFHVKTSSINWYVTRITKELNFFKVFDNHSRPYFIDSSGLIHVLSASISRSRLNEYFIRQVAINAPIEINIIADDIVALLVDKLRLIPPIFRRELRRLVLSFIEELLQDYNEPL
ncbi:MAG TPA: hypothetical protein VMV49_07320 [Candidatus Deferrimicrobium sp.]|nr:hypothetical protein [Candidatus Deferrimicrobium sp.]